MNHPRMPPAEHKEMFLLAEEAHAGWIEETLNRQLIRWWCG